MAYAPTAIHPRELAAPAKKTTSFWQRLLASMIVSRQRQAEREIATYLRHCGGKFTDEAEREIERLLSGANW